MMPRHRLPPPDAEAAAHSQRLARHIAEEIAARGPLPFAQFMALALYAPGLGYYSAGARKFGAGGDFVTAPELGPAFAHALAHHLAGAMAALPDWQLVELGAGSGALAADLLLALERRGALPTRYGILEVSADLRERQLQALVARCPHLLARVAWLDAPPEAAWRGALIGNEVVDALPATRFALREDGIHEQYVTGGPDEFAWLELPAPPAVAGLVQARLADRRGELPLPYRSELHATLGPWLAAVTDRLERGLVLLVDYGYPRSEYYLPERRDGTLVCHYRHHGHDDPLILVGLQDITAFVDFTALAEAAMACGLDIAGYTSQAQFLIGNDIEGYLAHADTLAFAERLRLVDAVKTLMLPGQMGERFQVMALTRGIDGEALHGFGHDLRYRLLPRP
jgi:SAM-dependent MidA family methyltransferase